MGFLFFGKKKKNKKENAANEAVVAAKANEAAVTEEAKAAPAVDAEINVIYNEEATENAPENKEANLEEAEKVAAPVAKKPATKKAPAPKKTPVKEEPVVVEKAEPVAEPAPVKAAYTGRYEIKRTKDDRYVFNLYATNKVIVATSQIYSSSQSAVNGIKSIMANAEKSPVEDNTLKEKTPLSFPKWEIYLDKAGQYRFRLYATNGSCVVHSQGYTTKASCKNGIDSIIRCSRNPEIDKAYLKKEN